MSVLIFSEPVPVLWPLLLPLVAMFARGGMFHEEKETGKAFCKSEYTEREVKAGDTTDIFGLSGQWRTGRQRVFTCSG